MSDQPSLASPDLAELIDYLVRTTRLSKSEAAHVVDEVLSFLNEPVEEFVRRRHRMLQHEGLANTEIFARIALEVTVLRFRSEPLSERQIRRMVYG
jgi:polyhydroxyalkanoate synthesis regulator phasin